MRVAGIPLNIATILIGSTVLGATENDQMHFFYHFQEGRSSGTTTGALRHALLIAGRPILFATLINASGFLALALLGPAADAPVRHRFLRGLRAGTAGRLHGTAGGAVDLEPAGSAALYRLAKDSAMRLAMARESSRSSTDSAAIAPETFPATWF